MLDHRRRCAAWSTSPARCSRASPRRRASSSARHAARARGRHRADRRARAARSSTATCASPTRAWRTRCCTASASRRRAGETIAIVGRSGSGKSTIVNLLPRFYDVTGGAVMLDGEDVREYPLERLRAQMSLVSQDVVLFNDTIRSNIAFGHRGRRTSEIEAAARAARVLEFADQMPTASTPMVGDRGALLSGGQRQRIAIARALLRNTPILILDEATSALDTELERQIQEQLEALMHEPHDARDRAPPLDRREGRPHPGHGRRPRRRDGHPRRSCWRATASTRCCTACSSTNEPRGRAAAAVVRAALDEPAALAPGLAVPRRRGGAPRPVPRGCCCRPSASRCRSSWSATSRSAARARRRSRRGSRGSSRLRGHRVGVVLRGYGGRVAGASRGS